MATNQVFGEPRLKIPIELNEGNYTRTEDPIVTESGMTMPFVITWADQVTKENFLRVSADYVAQNNPAGQNLLLGIAASAPKWGGGTDDPWPAASGATATTNLRTVTVNAFGGYTRLVTIASTGTGVAVADSVDADDTTAHEWEQDLTTNSSYVLVAATSGNKALVLFDFTGNF